MMGLAAYLYAVPKYAVEDPEARVDHREKEPRFAPIEVSFWRKYWPLQNHMTMLYRERGGLDEDFNLSTLTLTHGDIDNLRILFPDEELAWDAAEKRMLEGFMIYYWSWY